MRQRLVINPGDRIGKLEIIGNLNPKDFKKTGQVFQAKCDCGQLTHIFASEFKNGHKKSCGCSIKTRGKPKPFDKDKYLNKKFHNLLITEYIGTNRTNNGSLFHEFLYLCDCGNTGKITTSKIGRNLSCGCEYKKGFGDMSGTYFSKIKEHAEKREIEFHLTKEFLWDLFLKQDRKCALTGVELCFQSKALVYDGTASLDRIDSNGHYTEDNVQWVHKKVNNLKQSLPESELIEWCTLIVNHSQSHSTTTI